MLMKSKMEIPKNMAFNWKNAMKLSEAKMKQEIQMKKRIGEVHCLMEIEMRLKRLQKDIGL